MAIKKTALYDSIPEKIVTMGQFISILIIVNISLFIASGLVHNFRYFFPIIALVIHTSVYFLITLPWYNLHKNRNYLFLFILTWIGFYFTIASIIYMVKHGDFITVKHSSSSSSSNYIND